MIRVLVVDDEKKMVALLKTALEHRGFEVVGVFGGKEALDEVAATPFDVVLTDLRMEPVGGLEVIAGVKEISPSTAIIVLTAYGEVKTAIEALQAGAFQYLTKPFNLNEVLHVVEQATQQVKLERENRALKTELDSTLSTLGAQKELVGSSEIVKNLREMVTRVAPSDATVLIRGESGTGKEVVARQVHQASKRSGGPFIAVNCAAISESLLESELFGYRKGAFTGAESDREGLFEAARGGTVFLDEIGEAGLAVQAKLLRVLEEKKINRVGDPREREVDVRVLAATNRSLEKAIAERVFREDLYYRLLVFPLDVPPLRERTDDIHLLADHFLQRLGRINTKLSQTVINTLRAHPWPGNVRELRNLIERAHILAHDGPLADEHFLLQVAGSCGGVGLADSRGEDLNLDNNARRLIIEALKRSDGNKSLAAKMLGITRRTLYSRLKLLGIDLEI
ncbi:MAG: sigma-54 dependent transcriptional regulator [Gemmatimonadales bacterium]|nr:sigma-54 dependent transcriptional regulator [Gemmatimonadales bacterium]